MGAITGFSIDSNYDGKIDKNELKDAKKMGLDVSYIDKDGDGEVDAGVTVKNNSVFVGNEERVYESANNVGNKTWIGSNSIYTNPDGSKLVVPQDDIYINADGSRAEAPKDDVSQKSWIDTAKEYGAKAYEGIKNFFGF